MVGMLVSACQPVLLNASETRESPLSDGSSSSSQIPSPTQTEIVSQPTQKTPLVVFAAGSLIIPFAEIEKAFEIKYPDIDVHAEYHGSIQVMRHVTELHEPIDVVATADASLVPMLMYATNNPQTNMPYANWFIRFAGNKLALAYTENSRYADEIDVQNWTEILGREDVRYGLPDPRFDAAGYRAFMAFALQENEWQRYDIFKSFVKDQFSFPVTIFREDDKTTIRIPEILETKSGSHIFIRGASVFLIALMESGDLDYAFEYESVIRQHGLNMVSLPDSINLGDVSLRDQYRQVEVKLDFQRFSTVKPIFIGEPIEYAINIPSSSPHPEEAALFIQFLLSEEGRAVMEKNQHPLLDAYPADGFAHMPEILQELCVEE
jgi:molybdate/tungstate transport system substrate-binding protein